MKAMKTGLWFDKKEHIRTEINSYSNDVYEKLPFTLSPADAKLLDVELKNRISRVIYAKYPPSHWGGCGYSCSVDSLHREPGANTGYVILMHYNGIGD